jgi:hypothetical protein
MSQRRTVKDRAPAPYSKESSVEIRDLLASRPRCTHGVAHAPQRGQIEVVQQPYYPGDTHITEPPREARYCPWLERPVARPSGSGAAVSSRKAR